MEIARPRAAMGKLIVAASAALDWFARLFMTLVFGAIVLLVVSEVLSRNLLSISFNWLEEVTMTYLGTWLVFVGASHAMKVGMLASMDFFVTRIPRGLGLVCAVVSHLGVLGFLLAVVFFGCRLALLASDQPSPSLQWSMGLAYLGIVVGASFMVVHTLAALVETRRTFGHP